ncbi:MAG: fluoride efflux transporter CrcB [Clostridia bacterium]|nr:fluoride efflux transporter CrcB [Clostridia bacterium]
MEYLAVAVGGMVGALARYVLTGWVIKINESPFPYGTMIVNLVGSFLLGFSATLLMDRFQGHPYLGPLITVGILGSFTTFSTFQYESWQLIKTGMVHLALVNFFGSITLGLAVLWIGVTLARWL